VFTKRVKIVARRLEELSGLPIKQFISISMIVIFIGIYIASLVYGDNSLHRLNYLQNRKEAIKQEIENLKEENARLHKQYLEWSDAKE
jgi:cell division protein FtsB